MAQYVPQELTVSNNMQLKCRFASRLKSYLWKMIMSVPTCFIFIAIKEKKRKPWKFSCGLVWF